MMTTQLYIQKIKVKSLKFIVSRKFLTIRLLAVLFISLLSAQINAQTIGTVTVTGAPLCAGSTLSISFPVTNGVGSTHYFKTNSTFIVYLSNNAGVDFSQIAVFPSAEIPPAIDGASSTITHKFTIPKVSLSGIQYKISVGSVSPSFNGSAGVNASSAFSINASPNVIYTKVFASSCNGGTDGSINVTASAGTSPYTYSWTGPGSFAASTPNISGLSLGDYNVVVTDNNQCSASISGITIKQAPAVQVGVTKNIPTCAGNDGSLSAFRIGGVDDGINPIQYKLDGTTTVAYQNSGLFTGLTAGDYIVTAKDSKGCTGTALINLPSDPRPAPTVGILQKILPSCGQTNGSISALRIGGVADSIHPIQYKLDGDASRPYQNSNVFSGLDAGNYFVTVKDSRGCTGISAINLAEDTRPAPTIGVIQKTNPGCAFNDGTIDAFRIGGVADGITPIEFKLDGAATIPYQSSSMFSGLSAGSYIITVKDSRGCTGSSNITLSQPSPLSFTPNGYNTNVSACGGGSDGSTTVTVSGGVAPYHFVLDGVEKTVGSLLTYTISGLQPNISYNVTVTDSKGCSISKNVTLTQESTPTAEVNYTGNVTCIGGSDGFITSWQTGGVPGYSYSNDGGMTYQGSYRFLNLSAGNYSVVVKDSKGCISTPIAVTIADGTGSCTTGERIGNTTNNGTEDLGSNESGNLTKSSLNSSLTIQAFPNPSSSEFTLNVQGNNTDKVLITITDLLGRRMYQQQGMANQQYKLGSNLRNGIYIVQVLQGDNLQTIKIVKE